MTNYYTDKKAAFIELEKKILDAQKEGRTMKISLLTISFTKRFGIGENAIRKWLKVFCSAYPDLSVNEDEVTWN